MNAPDTVKVSFTFELAHSPEQVWRALTEPALVEKWIMPTDIDATLGHAFVFRARPTVGWDGFIACEVLAVEPQKRLQYTWRAAPLDTVVTWTLTPTSSGTQLGLEHDGFSVHMPAFSEGAREGWPNMVASLEEVLASSGEPPPSADENPQG